MPEYNTIDVEKDNVEEIRAKLRALCKALEKRVENADNISLTEVEELVRLPLIAM